jgi:hypothetical protein
VGLEFLNGPSRSAVWPVNRVVSLVGSSAGCKFRLADPSVSLFHCSLVRTQAGLWVVDLLGGVEVNNTASRFALLADGDILGIGRYRIRIQSPDVLGEAASADRRLTVRPAEGRSLALARTPIPGGGILPVGRRDDDQERSQGLAVPTMSVLPAEVAGSTSDPIAVMVPLMNQFGMMQQQMMDQFQSAMGMLVEMFGSLQREQMDLIRQELDQLREVTREVQELKSELASYAQDREAARASEAAAPPVVPPPIPTPTPAAETIAGVRVDPSRMAPAADLPPAAGPTVPSSDASTRAGEGKPGPARPGARPRPERPAPVTNDADVMLWLNQRISTLQEERESRWRKILKLLPGSS